MSELLYSLLGATQGRAAPIQTSLQNALYGYSDSPFNIAARGITSAAPFMYSPFNSSGRNLAVGVGSGLLAALLGGIGQNSTDARNKALLNAANEYSAATPELRNSIIEANPRLAAFGAATQAEERRLQQEAEAARLKAEQEMPKTREVKVGDEIITQQWDPSTKQFVELGRADRFRPSSGLESAVGLLLNKEFGDTPDIFQKDLVKEEGVLQEFERGLSGIKDMYDAAAKVPSFDAINPMSSDGATFQANRSAIKLNILSHMKGVPSDKDMAVIDQMLPNQFDTQARIEAKKQAVINFLEQQKAATPTLSRFGKEAYKKTTGAPPKRSDFPSGPEGARAFVEAGQRYKAGR